MAAVIERTAGSTGATSPDRPWRIVGQGAAALAAGMGVGRFAYTPILPLMHVQAGLSPQLGAQLATANYGTGLVALAADRGRRAAPPLPAPPRTAATPGPRRHRPHQLRRELNTDAAHL